MSFRTEEERRTIHKMKYGTETLPPRGTGQMLVNPHMELTPQARQYLKSRVNQQKTVTLKQRWGLMETKGYPLWSLAKIFLSLSKGTERLSVNKSVLWGDKTTILNAKISISGDVDAGSCDLTLLMNGVPVATHGWLFGDLHHYSDSIDVIGNLVNGANSFEVRFNKLPMITAPVTLTLTANLEIEYTGEEPEVPTLPRWVPWALAVSLGLGVTYLLIRR